MHPEKFEVLKFEVLKKFLIYEFKMADNPHYLPR